MATNPPTGTVAAPLAAKRNHCMDAVKGLACIAIVFMHCEFPGRLGTLVQCLSRFGVPFFFMVSGYFCHSSKGRPDYGRKLRHVLEIALWTTLFYALVTPLYAPWEGWPDPRALRNWLLFNKPFYIAGQMWFLFALLYDYALFALFDRKGFRWVPWAAVPVGIAVYVAMAQGAHLAGIRIPNMWYRNFLVEGFSLFSLGYLLRTNAGRIRVSDRLLWTVLAVSTLLCPVERALLGRDFGVNIATFPQVAALFLLCIRNPGLGEGSRLAALGLKYSLLVYVLHPAAWHLLDLLYSAAGIAGVPVVAYLRPILCATLAVAASMAFVALKGAFQGKSAPLRASTRSGRSGGRSGK